MFRQVRHIIASALLGAGLGAVAALITAEVSLQSGAGGAIIGLVIGLFFGLRSVMRQSRPPGLKKLRDQERGKHDKLRGQAELELNRRQFL